MLRQKPYARFDAVCLRWDVILAYPTPETFLGMHVDPRDAKTEQDAIRVAQERFAECQIEGFA